MGKSWKKKARFLADTPIDFKWSSQCYTLKEILTNFKLPVVVQCRDDTNAEHVQNFFFDLRQPIVLHSRRTIRKVFTRCVRKGPGGTFKELLPEVVIPEDYAGWFKLSKGLTFDKPSPHTSIESLTRSNSEFFLCTTDFNAIVLPKNPDTDNENTEDDDDDDTDGEHFIRPISEGEVLRKTGVQKLNQMMLPECHRSATNDSRYLMCIDEKDNELFIPLSQTGLFYEVSDGSFNKTDNSVLQISDLVEEMVELPLYVRHILGDPPPISQFYSPCLKLDRIKEEETVMGSTLDTGGDSLPLEIQTFSPIKFEIALNTPMLQSSMEYIDSVDTCNTVVQNYVTDMKLAVNFKLATEDDDNNPTQVYTNPSFVPDEHEAPSSSICNSQRTSIISGSRGSEFGEEEATSEFSIQWDPAANQSFTGTERSSNSGFRETDCVSIDSLDNDSARKFNSILGGKYVETDDELSNASPSISKRRYPEVDVDGTLKAEKQGDRILKSNSSDIEITHYVDIVEEITDFSMYSSETNSRPSGSLSSNSTKLIQPPSQFRSDTNSTSQQSSFSLSSMHRRNSSTSTIESGHSEIDLSDHFPSIHSSTNSVSGNTFPSLEVNTSKEFTFTGDVFINHFEDNQELPEKDCDQFDRNWDNKYKVIKRKDLPRNRARNPETGSLHRVGVSSNNSTSSKIYSSLSDDLIRFEETNNENNTKGIITCQVADEMVSSYNDLRLSLEEVTRNAKDGNIENKWKQFCLERSCSLPVRSKHSKDRKYQQTEDHSQSWEQISPRRNDDMSVVSAHPSHKTASVSEYKPSNALHKLNVDYDSTNGDQTQLILDTSSEFSSQYSQKGSYSDDSANSSFTISEHSDDENGIASRLAEVSETDMYLSIENIDTSVRDAAMLSREKAMLSQQMKIKHEIKRKKEADWGDNIFVI